MDWRLFNHNLFPYIFITFSTGTPAKCNTNILTYYKKETNSIDECMKISANGRPKRRSIMTN